MPTEPILADFKCLFVEKNKINGEIQRSIRSVPLPPLAKNHVRIKVEYSSLNYKDALCAIGHTGVARKLPITPGIDAAGTVIESPNSIYKPGTAVMVFHADFGTAADGGLSQIVDVPGDWVYELPENFSAREAMILGTAGFTAAQSVDQLQRHGITPERGELVVTGATGGVGVCAVKLLAKLGYDVVASTGKLDRTDWLTSMGASRVIDRKELGDTSDRPLLPGRWAGAIDTVGGNILATIMRSTKPHGCVTACGLVAGVDLNLTVYPFILRGVTLQGIDTAGISRNYRAALWDRLATEWALNDLENLSVDVGLEGVDEKIDDLLNGRVAGRIVVKLP